MRHLAKDLVLGLLRDFPETRDSDKSLIIRALEHEGLFLTLEQQEIFFKCHSVETLRRTRQHLQEKGFYPASPNVKQARMKKEVEMRQEFIMENFKGNNYYE